MNKLELAHEYAKVMLTQNITRTDVELAELSFSLAEAMLAENEKRQDKSRPEALDRGISGDYTDYGEIFGNSAWQPDWSQAPEGCHWWAMDESRKAFWFAYEPYISSEYPDEWIFNGKNHGGLGFEYWKSSDFNYQGDWKDSLRKRP